MHGCGFSAFPSYQHQHQHHHNHTLTHTHTHTRTRAHTHTRAHSHTHRVYPGLGRAVCDGSDRNQLNAHLSVAAHFFLRQAPPSLDVTPTEGEPTLPHHHAAPHMPVPSGPSHFPRVTAHQFPVASSLPISCPWVSSSTCAPLPGVVRVLDLGFRAHHDRHHVRRRSGVHTVSEPCRKRVWVMCAQFNQ